MRRRIQFQHLDQAVEEAKSLLANGYNRAGNWTLGQVCAHLRLTIEANMNGYPTWMTVLGYPLRPILRHFALPQLLAGNSPSGIRTAARFIAADDVDDTAEVEKFVSCVEQFLKSMGPMHTHPGFGNMTKDQFNHFHAAHAAHHLGYLIPINKLD